MYVWLKGQTLTLILKKKKKHSVNEHVPVITINVAIIVICWFRLLCLFDLSPCLSAWFPSHFHILLSTLISVTDVSVSHFGANLLSSQKVALLIHSYPFVAFSIHCACSLAALRFLTCHRAVKLICWQTISVTKRLTLQYSTGKLEKSLGLSRALPGDWRCECHMYARVHVWMWCTPRWGVARWQKRVVGVNYWWPTSCHLLGNSIFEKL